MSDEPKTPETGLELAGIPIAEFSVAVTAFEQLRNEGSFWLFLGRNNGVRIIGDVSEFAARVTKTLPQLRPDFVETALEEIRQFVQMLLSGLSPDQAARLMVEGPYVTVPLPDDQSKATYRDYYRRKIELVHRLINRGLQDRSNRLACTLAPVLEDVDIEVITQRHSQVDNRTVQSPFLRLGIRYSEPGTENLWFYPPFAKPRSDLKQFAVECDVLDIDLLIARLLRAKELLTQVITSKTESPASNPPAQEKTNE